MRPVYFLLIALLIFSCNEKKNSTVKNPNSTLNKFLNDDALASQFFTVNTGADTTLITKNGCIIRIPKGSIESDNNNVKLDIKEALTNTDIVLGGMTTQSDGQPLSSGGMIYFNAAAGYKITIKKAIQVLVPTNSYNRDMIIYKGEKEKNGINWTSPDGLPQDSTNKKIDDGERMFKSFCSTCHKIYDDFTGPALYKVTERRPKKWLYDFVRHATEMVQRRDTKNDSASYYNDPYAYCLLQKYHQMMTQFDLTDNDLDKIFGYIKEESDKRPSPGNISTGGDCCDSCEAYRNKLRGITIENTPFFTLERTIPLPVVTNVEQAGNIDTTAPPPYSKVTPSSATAVYYTVNISAVGWYNIDVMLKQSATTESELFVRLQGSFKIDMNVVLVIPSVKVFAEGGKLKDNEQYGFDEDNGSIPLPQNVKAYVLAFGESDNKIIFGKTVFNTETKQTINVSLEESTKEKIIAEIKGLDLDGIKAQIEKTKNPEMIIEMQKKIEAAENFRPKNCDCGFGEPK